MRKLALTLTAASFVLGMTALTASAQTQQRGATSLKTQLRNATPIVTPAACGGPGPYCDAGWVRRCWRDPHGRGHIICRCVRCY